MLAAAQRELQVRVWKGRLRVRYEKHCLSLQRARLGPHCNEFVTRFRFRTLQAAGASGKDVKLSEIKGQDRTDHFMLLPKVSLIAKTSSPKSKIF